MNLINAIAKGAKPRVYSVLDGAKIPLAVLFGVVTSRHLSIFYNRRQSRISINPNSKKMMFN